MNDDNYDIIPSTLNLSFYTQFFLTKKTVLFIFKSCVYILYNSALVLLNINAVFYGIIYRVI